jgi:hypothetical protein
VEPTEARDINLEREEESIVLCRNARDELMGQEREEHVLACCKKRMIDFVENWIVALEKLQKFAIMDSDSQGDTYTKTDAQAALESLPSEGVVWACAYGSRYMEAAKSSQLDLIVAVESEALNAWHYENITRNPKHYFPSNISSLAYGLATHVRPPKMPIFPNSTLVTNF